MVIPLKDNAIPSSIMGEKTAPISWDKCRLFLKMEQTSSDQDFGTPLWDLVTFSLLHVTTAYGELEARCSIMDHTMNSRSNWGIPQWFDSSRNCLRTRAMCWGSNCDEPTEKFRTCLCEGTEVSFEEILHENGRPRNKVNTTFHALRSLHTESEILVRNFRTLKK